MESGTAADGTGGDGGLSTPGQPGFGVLVAVAALLGAALSASRRG